MGESQGFGVELLVYKMQQLGPGLALLRTSKCTVPIDCDTQAAATQATVGRMGAIPVRIPGASMPVGLFRIIASRWWSWEEMPAGVLR